MDKCSRPSARPGDPARPRSLARISRRLPEVPISSELREEILAGRSTRERKLALCAGSISLAPEDRAELLAFLSADSDPMIAERAGSALLSQTPDAFLAALTRENAARPCPPQLIEYCAHNLADKPGVADALARNRYCPLGLLIPLAHRLSFSAVSALLDDLDRLSSAPALVSALLASPSPTLDQRQQLNELLEKKSDAAAIEEAVSVAEPDGARRVTLLQRLMRMTVVERVQLALKGGREERVALIRDPCKVVQRAVLQSSKISDREIESYATMANLSDEILRIIGTSRAYRKNYTVTKNLVNNPKTPLDVSLHLLPNITAQDLKMLCMNKNIPETLAAMAKRLHHKRQEKRPGG